MKNSIWLLALLLGMNLAACSGSGAENQDAEEPAATSADAPAGTDAATVQDAMKQAEEAMKNAGAGQQAEPVNFRDLQNLLPENASGFKRTNKSGETAGAMGFKVSKAEGKYEDGDKSADLDLVDTGGMGMSMMSMAAWATVTVDKEDENGYERTGTLDGYKSFEKGRKNGGSSELSVIVANRFIVTARGRNCEMDDLKSLVKAVDLKKLEGLK